MRNLLIILIAVSALIFNACNDNNEEVKDNTQQQMNENQTQTNAPESHEITVMESMDASGYTYMKVKEGGSEYWIAVNQMEVKPGAKLYYSKYMEMNNFESKSLNKTFDKILFVEGISTTPQTQNMVPPGHQNVMNISKDKIDVKPLSDGKTVADIHAQAKSLAGKTVKVKGKVVKYNPNIMDRNWIHIQDGTGGENDFDLMVTSDQSVKVGDTVIIEGNVAVGKDFGMGYYYDVMIENAKITLVD